MTDLEKMSEQTDTSIEILQAIAELVGDDEGAIRETLDVPKDFDAILTGARARIRDHSEALRWQGRAIG